MVKGVRKEMHEILYPDENLNVIQCHLNFCGFLLFTVLTYSSLSGVHMRSEYRADEMTCVHLFAGSEHMTMITIMAGSIGILGVTVLSVSATKAIMTYYERLRLQ